VRVVYTISVILSVLCNQAASKAEEVSNELWIMVKTDSYYRTQKDLDIVDYITVIVDENALGELDGHSSGAHQFDFNYFGVEQYPEAEKLLEKELRRKYPQLIFRISSEYQSVYDRH